LRIKASLFGREGEEGPPTPSFGEAGTGFGQPGRVNEAGSEIFSLKVRIVGRISIEVIPELISSSKVSTG